MSKATVIGISNPNEIILYSDQKPFRLDEYFSVEGSSGSVICRVIETKELSSNFLEESYLKELKLDDGAIVYIGKAKIEEEQFEPIHLNQKAESLNQLQIQNLLTPTDKEVGLVLGEINGTDTIYDDCIETLKEVSPMMYNDRPEKQKKIPYLLNFYDFFKFPHLGLFGGSGSGKSYALKTILEELLEKKVPNIILDPHFEMSFDQVNGAVNKYRKNPLEASAYANNYKVFYVGKDIGINFTELTTDELCSLLLFKGELSQPMLSLINEIHTKGDSSVLVARNISILSKFREMEDNKKKIEPSEHDGKEINYYNAMKSKIPSLATVKAVEWRFEALMGENIFNADILEAEKAFKMRKSIVLRGSNAHLNMLGCYLFKKFYNNRRKFVDSNDYGLKNVEPFPPFFITIDEAHIFVPNGNSSSPTRSILKTISQEGRKYGVFEIMSTQRPQLLDETVVAQLSTKIILRTNISQDLEVIKKETNLSDAEIDRLPYLDSGNAFISSAISKNTASIRFRANFTKAKSSKNPFEELTLFKEEDLLTTYLLKALPITDMNIEDKVKDFKAAHPEEIISKMRMIETLEDLATKGLLKKEKTVFGFVYA